MGIFELFSDNGFGGYNAFVACSNNESVAKAAIKKFGKVTTLVDDISFSFRLNDNGDVVAC